MKKSISIFAIACALLGAGCSTPPSEESSPLIKSAAETASSLAPQIEQESQKPMINTNALSFPGVLPESETHVNVRMKTNKGDIVIEVLPNEGPNAASNFVYLIKQKYYDGLTFHRYEPNFVIQGGDPTGTGGGGPGYTFKDDPVRPADENPYVDLRQTPRGMATVYLEGTVAMANAGPNTNGSQFFIMNADAPMVGPDYSVFGHVIKGMDVVKALRAGDMMESVTVEN